MKVFISGDTHGMQDYCSVQIAGENCLLSAEILQKEEMHLTVLLIVKRRKAYVLRIA